MDLASGQALALRRRTNWICSVFWTPTVAPAEPSSLTSSTIRKAAALHAHIYFSLFPRVGRTTRTFPACCYTYRRTPSIHIIITRVAHMFFLYIYVYILLPITSAHIYMYIYIYEHIVTRAHTYTYTIFLYVYSYIFTQLHIYYIIVLYVSEKERPVDYGRSAFLMSEWM